jgi:hypothetical protein
MNIDGISYDEVSQRDHKYYQKPLLPITNVSLIHTLLLLVVFEVDLKLAMSIDVGINAWHNLRNIMI